MGKRGPRPNDAKDAIMRLLAQGMFTSLAEASLCCGITPQRIGQWCEAANLDWRAARQRHCEVLWQKERRRMRVRLKGKDIKPRSKHQQRLDATQKVNAFLAKGGKIKR